MARDMYLGGIAQVKAYRTIQATVSESVKSFGLNSVSEWLMLCHVYYNKNVTAKDLAALLEVEAPLSTRLVANLSDAGLVKITPHPTDKRVKLINTTPKAKRLVLEVESEMEEKLNKLLEGLTSNELNNYRKVLDKIILNGNQP